MKIKQTMTYQKNIIIKLNSTLKSSRLSQRSVLCILKQNKIDGQKGYEHIGGITLNAFVGMTELEGKTSSNSFRNYKCLNGSVD